ncbi:MAG: DNA-formamidopyrimidine glycosylase family protein [Solirubrobacterales bacterium]
MAEGDTILRAARRIEAALGGQELEVRARSGRARTAGLERVDGRRLERVEARGKNLLLHFGGLVIHSHMGMSGSWHIYKHGARWSKPAGAAWVTLSGAELEAVQFGGPTLRLLSALQLRSDPVLSRLGPDILAADFDPSNAAARLCASPGRELGDALLDQRLIAGIGNIFKSEACFAARASPWRKVGEIGDGEIERVLEAGQRLMGDSVESGRPSRAVYHRAGQPCKACGTPIAARGQGDANRRTYWCPRCQQ